MASVAKRDAAITRPWKGLERASRLASTVRRPADLPACRCGAGRATLHLHARGAGAQVPSTSSEPRPRRGRVSQRKASAAQGAEPAPPSFRADLRAALALPRRAPN
eukprot:scaffold962_cov372-Prasinococcus_capsulatus_cf.AAC.9